MEPDSREEKNALSFLDHIASSGGYSLRPPGYLTIQNVELLELDFSKDEEELTTLDKINAYLFLQAAPLPRVARALRAYRKTRRTKSREEAWEDLLCDHVEPFLGELTPEIKAELEGQLGQLDEIDAARVIAEPPPGSKTERLADPN